MADNSIMQILSMPPEERKSRYRAAGIDKVIVDGNEFTDYGAFSFIWEKTYVKSPERSADGTIGNLDSYATFVTPHLKIDFSMMSIDSYRTMMNLIYLKNEFLVTCYDVVNNKPTTQRMYFATEEMPKLWTIARAINGEEQWVELLGVQDYTVEMIGTNVALDKVSVIYHKNPPIAGMSDQTVGSDGVPVHTDVIIGQPASEFVAETYEGAYKFKNWNTSSDGSGITYINGNVYTVNDALVLYAIWQTPNSATLSYNFGFATPVVVGVNVDPYSKSVQYGQAIGDFPRWYVEQVEGTDGNMYTPYYNPSWHKTTNKNSDEVLSSTEYWTAYNSTIYLLFDTIAPNVSYVTNSSYANDTTFSVEYGASLPTYNITEPSRTFRGWYLDSNFTNPAPSTMPPNNITLYAKWE